MKRAIFSAFAIGSAVLALLSKKQRSASNVQPQRIAPTQAGSLLNLTLAGILPLWIIAGCADYLWHRRTHIETTSGFPESASHVLMMLETAPLVLTSLFLDINAGALSLMTGSLALHEATVAWDLRYAAGRRVTFPGEQQVHSALEVLPACILWSAVVLHWPQALSMIGKGPEKPQYSLSLRRPILPAPTIFAIIISLTFFVFLPHVEELWRCWQAKQQGLAGSETPQCLAEVYGKQAA